MLAKPRLLSARLRERGRERGFLGVRNNIFSRKTLSPTPLPQAGRGEPSYRMHLWTMISTNWTLCAKYVVRLYQSLLQLRKRRRHRAAGILARRLRLMLRQPLGIIPVAALLGL